MRLTSHYINGSTGDLAPVIDAVCLRNEKAGISRDERVEVHHHVPSPYYTALILICIKRGTGDLSLRVNAVCCAVEIAG
jgi:hypothetical protein